MTETDSTSVTSVVIPTSKDALLQHHGAPVPWVTRWTGEVTDEPIQMARQGGAIKVLYADGNENREDETSILWIREGITRRGEPEYSQVNSYRQRASMSRRICQVCGTKIAHRPIRWLADPRQLERLDDGSIITSSPPTCASCVPLALDICPNFKKQEPVILKVLEYELWGVMGEAVVAMPDGSIRHLSNMRCSYDQKNLFSNFVAKQQVARLTKFTIEKYSAPANG